MRRRSEPWEDWEADVSVRLDGRRVAASGATDYAKGDVVTDRYLIDCKYTEGTYRLDSTMWGKISSWGRNEGLDPIVAVRSARSGEFAVMDESLYCSLFGRDTSGESPKEHLGFVVNSSGLRHIGNWRLMAMPFAEFEEVANETQEH